MSDWNIIPEATMFDRPEGKVNEKNVVYVVTAGSYSNYRIKAVFDDEKLAEAYAELLNRPHSKYDWDAQVEVYDVNSTIPLVERGTLAWHVYFDERSGASTSGWDGEVTESIEEIRPGCIRCQTQQPTKEAAIKVCAERRAQFIAEREGIA